MTSSNSKPTEIRPQPGPQEAFLATAADIAIYGGAAGGGKTWALLAEPLRHAHNPGFVAAVFRRTAKQVTNAGGLWSESEALYPLAGGAPVTYRLLWRFPRNAIITFVNLEHEQDKLNYQGAQIAYLAFDELTHFSESQFFFMLSRNRSMSGVRPYVRATCNPDPDSFLVKGRGGRGTGLISWWIGSDGFPIPDRCGTLRWMVRRDDEIKWGDSQKEMLKRFPNDEPKSVTFIAAKLNDNQILERIDPGYRANLNALPYAERMRLLHGNWLIRDTDGVEFPDEWFGDHIWADEWPHPDDIAIRIMALDPAKSTTKAADYSALVELSITHDGLMYVDADLAKRDPVTICNTVVDRGLAFVPDGIAVESINFQSLLCNIIQSECERRGKVSLPIFEDKESSRGKNKQMRIRRLAPYLQNEGFRFRRNSPGCQMLVDQLRGFPLPTVHDDGPDSLEMAVRLARQMQNMAPDDLPDQFS